MLPVRLGCLNVRGKSGVMVGREAVAVMRLPVWIGTIRAWNDQHRSERYLSQDERLCIADLLRAGLSIRAISRQMGRSASSISREVRLGTNPASNLYEPYHAHQQAHLRRKRPKTAKILDNPVLFALVEQWLGKHWSPEQISGRLKQMYPHDDSMHLCTETIYQAIDVHAKGRTQTRREKGSTSRTSRT